MMGEWIVIAYFLKCPVYVMRKWCLSVGPAWLGEGMLQLGTHLTGLQAINSFSFLIWLHQVLVAARRVFIASVGSLVAEYGI